MSSSVALAPAAVVVAVDVGKTRAAVLVSDAQRHRLGASGEQDRLRAGPRPGRLRPCPLGLTTPWASSIAANSPARSRGQPGAPAAQRGRTRLTGASTGTHFRSEEAPKRR
jgi:hypothetical protein